MAHEMSTNLVKNKCMHNKGVCVWGGLSQNERRLRGVYRSVIQTVGVGGSKKYCDVLDG